MIPLVVDVGLGKTIYPAWFLCSVLFPGTSIRQRQGHPATLRQTSATDKQTVSLTVQGHFRDDKPLSDVLCLTLLSLLYHVTGEMRMHLQLAVYGL